MKNEESTEDKYLHQEIDTTNKPSFTINTKRKGSLPSQKLYNHFLKVVLSEYVLNDKRGNHDKIFYTTMTEMKNHLGWSKKTKGNDKVWEYIKELQSNQLEVITDYTKETPNGGKWASYPLLGGCRYTILDDLIEFDMSSLFLRELTNLDEKNGRILYAKIEDRFIKNFKNPYSVSMYEFLKDNEYKYNLKLDVEIFRELLDVGEKHKDWRNYKRYILEKPLQELKEKTTMNFEYRYINGTGIDKGNHYIEFKFHPKNEFIQDKGEISKDEFIQTMKFFYQKTGFTLNGFKYLFNEKGYLTTKTGKNLMPDEGLEVWTRLYKKYYGNPTYFIEKKLKMTEDEFYSVVRG